MSALADPRMRPQEGHAGEPAAGRLATFVKICGCRDTAAVAAAVTAGAGAVGFVLVPGLRRFIDPLRARALGAGVPPGVWRVGVFLDQPLDEVAAFAAAAGVDTVQLHGSESVEAVRALQARGLRVIKAWQGTGPFPGAADRVLVEPHAGRPGGTGLAWDWDRVRGLPVILAGGLDAANVAQALDDVRPFGVDVSSGVETGGEKDPEKIRVFCAAVRRWEDGHAGEARPVAGPPG